MVSVKTEEVLYKVKHDTDTRVEVVRTGSPTFHHVRLAPRAPHETLGPQHASHASQAHAPQARHARERVVAAQSWHPLHP